MMYELKVEGHLDTRWDEWFTGLSIIHQSDGTTMLYGTLADQTALHSVLARIRDMNLPLISVQRVENSEKRR